MLLASWFLGYFFKRFRSLNSVNIASVGQRASRLLAFTVGGLKKKFERFVLVVNNQSEIKMRSYERKKRFFASKVYRIPVLRFRAFCSTTKLSRASCTLWNPRNPNGGRNWSIADSVGNDVFMLGWIVWECFPKFLGLALHYRIDDFSNMAILWIWIYI